MLSTNIKEATKEAHLALEKKVIEKMKAIRSDADYADFLKYFYIYFAAVEQAIVPFFTAENAELLPDHTERRNSSFLKKDIEELGYNVNDVPAVTVAKIDHTLQALGALYVMEGSIMGGPIIVKMLEKLGIVKGISFFSGYGADTGVMWGKFIAVLNAQANTEEEEQLAIVAANDTFFHFGEVFEKPSVAS